MIIARFDGSCILNPGGPAGWGFEITQNNTTIHNEFGKIDGQLLTNNIAECTGLIKILEWLIANKPAEQVIIEGDSKLAINLLSGNWNTTKPHLQSLKDQASILLAKLPDIKFRWIARERNSSADSLASQGSHL